MHRVARHAQRLFELSSDLLAIVDAERRVVGANPAWEHVLARRPADVIGMRFEQLTHPDDLVRTREAAARLLRDGEAIEIDTRLLHADGSARWIRWSARRDPEDRLVYAAGRDVTAEVRAAEAAETAVRRLEAAQRVAGMGSFEFDLRTGEVSYTREMFRLYGLDPERAEPLRLRAFRARVVPEDRERIDALLDAAVQGGVPISGDFRMAHAPDRVLHAIVEVERDAAGRPTVGRGTVQDVTDLRAAEARLRASERRLAEAERIAQLGSVDWCRQDGSVEWSEGMYRLYGLPLGSPPLSEEEFLARMRPDEAQRVREATAHAAATLGSWELDYHIIDAHGRPRALQTRCEAYRENGTTRFRAAVQDVTGARRQSQQQDEVARLAEMALAGGDPQAFFREVCATVSRVLDTSLSAIAEVHADGSATAVAGIGWASETHPSALSPQNPSLSRIAAETGQPIVIDDWRDEDRFPYSIVLREAGIRSTAIMPIAGRDRPFGVLATNSREPGFLQRADVAFLEALAAILATAIERFRSDEEIAELAAVRGRLVAESVEAEERARRRISEELHDGVLQDLLAARQDLIEAESDVAGGGPKVASARTGVERAVAQLRDAVHALHPVVLQHGGLLAALQAAAEQAGRQGGFAADVAVSPDAMGVRDELVLSVARELLTNAAKHAGASRVAVTVWREGDAVVLEVEDDGRGIDLVAAARAPLQGHIGLAALGQRVEATGGTFAVTPLAGRPGTVVRAVIPAA